MIDEDGDSGVLDNKFEEAYKILNQRLYNEDLGDGKSSEKVDGKENLVDFSQDEFPEIGERNTHQSFRDKIIHNKVIEMQASEPFTEEEKKHFFRGKEETALRMER